jgi:hypothetical protein
MKKDRESKLKALKNIKKWRYATSMAFGLLESQDRVLTLTAEWIKNIFHQSVNTTARGSGVKPKRD